MMQTLIEKLNSSLVYLENDIPFSIDRYSIKLIGNLIEVYCYSLYKDMNYYTNDNAIKELSDAKNNFLILMNQSLVFKNYAKMKEMKFSLLMDYGNGAVLICKE